ncbi:MAG: hypothetical protein QM479_09420 [Pseudomonadota bacterium]
MENTLQNSLALEKDRYQINKLICVNSMKNICYLELDVTQNTVLYGENNLGKTSILSTLKLHLLPEINFQNSKNKFAFMGASGTAYNNQESRDFYFPSINSFLILEGQNPFGPYVTILFRSSDEQFGYARIVLPVSYKQIEHEFWDKTSPVNNHLGAINPQLSLKRIKALVKEYSGRLLRTSQEIRETIYTFNQLNEEKGRFCIIPMKGGGVGREVEAFRRLLQFTFEINQGSPASLTTALATIIEGQKKSKKDELNQNLQVIIDEYNDLNGEQEKITCLKNTQDYYQRIKKSFEKAQKSLLLASQKYWQLKFELLSQQNNLHQQEQKIKPEYEAINDDLLPEQVKLHTRIIANKQQIKTNYDELNGKFRGLQKERERLKYLLEDEFSHIENKTEIEEILLEDKQQLEADIHDLQDKESFITALQDKIKKQNSLKQQLESLSQQLNNSENALLYKITPHSASVLKTINPHFDHLTIAGQDTEVATEIDKINEFCLLFQQNKQQLHCLNQDFIPTMVHFDPLKQQHLWEDKKQQLQKQLQLLSMQIDKNSKQINNLSDEQLVEQKNTKEIELKKTSFDLSLIINMSKINQDYYDNTQQLEQLSTQLKHITQELENSQQQLTQLKEQKQHLKEQMQTLKNQNKIFERLQTQIKRYTEIEKQLIEPDDDQVLVSGEQANKLTINDEAMASLVEDIDSFQHALTRTEQTIHDLILKEKLPLLDTQSVYRLGKTLNEIKPLIEQLAAEYEHIESYQKHLQLRVRKHNKIVGSKVSELEQNNQLINDFRHKLNHAFSDIKISDLEQIKIKLKLDPRFVELLADIQSQSVDFYNDSLISADFYDKLNTFCGQFFSSRNGQQESLTLQGVIKEVLYEYRIIGQQHRTTSSQSNGTNAIINCTFLTILLNELIQPNIILALPVVFDEIANLDFSNMQSVVNVVKSNHFSLFSATPTENLQLNHSLGHFIHLDLFKATEQSYHQQRNIIYYGGAESIEELAAQ